MRGFDLTPYRRSTVGFDRLFDLIENNARLAQGDNYPPFNIERLAEDRYRVTLPSPASVPRKSTSPPSRTCSR